jgi:hypothetical protein
MKSTSLPDGTKVQFNLIDKELIKSLNEYTSVQLSKIPLTRIPPFLNTDKITAKRFINNIKKNYFDNSEKQSFNQETYYQVTNLYNDLISIATTLYRDPRSYEEFELRRELMGGILPNESSIIFDNLGGSNDDCYVFCLLFEIIFSKMELTWVEKEVVKYCSGYSKEFKSLTHHALAKKLNISEYEIKRAERSADKKIDNLISKFKIFKSCIAYRLFRTDDRLDDFLIIRPDLCQSVREKEQSTIMTDLFIAKVISGICNYKMKVIDPGNRKYIRLIKNGLKDSNISIRFYNNLAEMFESGKATEATKDIFDSIVESLEQGYKDYDTEDYYEEEEYLEHEKIINLEVPKKGTNPEEDLLDRDDLEDLEFRDGQEN